MHTPTAEIFIYSTDPLKADTDGDGYSDGAEVAAGSDPLNPASIPADFWRDYGLILILIIIGAVVGAVVVTRVTRSRKIEPKKVKPKPPKAAPAKVEVAPTKAEVAPTKAEITPAKPPIVIEETLTTKKTTKIMERGLKLFFSYSSRDSERYHIAEFARRLTELPDVEEALYWEKDATSSIIEYMDANVGKCDIFILFCSEQTVSSGAVKIEWQAALSIGKDIVPVYDNLDHVPTLLKTFRGVRFREDDIDGTINNIHELIIKKLTLHK